jgi:hypothetical protein
MGLARELVAQPLPSPAVAEPEGPRPLGLVRPRRTRRNRTVAILKIPRLWPAPPLGRTATAAAIDATGGTPVDGLDAFGSEAAPSIEPRIAIETPHKEHHASAVHAGAAGKWLLVILLSAGAAVAGLIAYQKRFPRTASTGSVTIETSPAGLEVVLAGKSLGKTPLTTSLAPGAYEVQVGTAPEARTLKLNVTAGVSVVQHVEFAAASGASSASGGLRVQTEPAHLPVTVDGVARGAAPVTIDQLTPGEHEISVKTSAGVIHRTVSVQPRETLSLIVSSAAPAAEPGVVAAGWLSVSAPVALQLREGGKVIGTTESDRLMLPAGDHDIELSNEALGFTAKRTIRVTAGKTAATKIDLPNGTLSLNAQPWAEVFVDGERVGETPIGNLSRAIGSHEVLFRHPDLGERREVVVITVGKPARVGVDLRKK